MFKDQKGIIHLIPIFILLVGIIAGVYLVQKKGFQIFKPKAAAESIQLLDGPCVKTKSVNGQNVQVLTCDHFQFRLTSPTELGE